MRGAATITALCGAGISTDSGIPDFRGPAGGWTRNPAAQQMSHYRTTSATGTCASGRGSSRRQHAAWTAEPNAGHRALVELEQQGRLAAMVTQNIDESPTAGRFVG